MKRIYVEDLEKKVDNYYRDNDVYFLIQAYKGDGSEIGNEVIVDSKSPWNALDKIRSLTNVDNEVIDQINYDEDENWRKYHMPGFKSDPLDSFPSIRKESENG